MEINLKRGEKADDIIISKIERGEWPVWIITLSFFVQECGWNGDGGYGKAVKGHRWWIPGVNRRQMILQMTENKSLEGRNWRIEFNECGEWTGGRVVTFYPLFEKGWLDTVFPEWRRMSTEHIKQNEITREMYFSGIVAKGKNNTCQEREYNWFINRTNASHWCTGMENINEYVEVFVWSIDDALQPLSVEMRRMVFEETYRVRIPRKEYERCVENHTLRRERWKLKL